jgi:hypothetical protein
VTKPKQRSPFAQFVVHTFDDLETSTFCPRDYSRLKFGSDVIARKFGDEMAEKFFSEHYDVLTTDRCVIIPSAFNVVEIAATILARHFMNRLNDLLSREGHRLVEWTTMHRTMSYVADYSFLPKEERAAMLEADKLYINRDFIDGKVLLFVDDVTITGSHEHKIVDFLKSHRLNNPRVFCYYARYLGETADIEAALNQASISGAEEYMQLIREPGHHLVVRAVRFLLDQPIDELKSVLRFADGPFVDRLYHACLAKEYDKLETYREGFELIRARHDRMGIGLMNVERAA